MLDNRRYIVQIKPSPYGRYTCEEERRANETVH